MFCPKCGFEKTKVYGTKKGLINERFRVCEKCGYKFLTVESIKADMYAIEYKEYLKEIKEIDDKIIKKE